MARAQLQEVDGTVMLELPQAVLDELHLDRGASVDVEVKGDVVLLQRDAIPQYRLDDLISQSDPRAFEQNEEDLAWHRSGPVGRELL